jgi:hypothetical protein
MTEEIKTKHTPGPWILGEALDAPGGNALGVRAKTNADWSANGELVDYVCLISPIDKVTKNDFANAKLIAAAPDLLEVAKKALIHFEHLNIEHGVQEDLRIAIKNAEQ